jgi:type II restriction enzyme|tara:strand:- start:47 stop:490 length:444 start_codon:yes stop_codon:yes gene_type:complete
MPTDKQKLGVLGEDLIVKNLICQKCKKKKTLKKLPMNFKCADLICDFCGFLAQVKSSNVRNINNLPNSILGAAWKPQQERMDAGIYFPLYLVLVNGKNHSVFYLSADLQSKDIFIPRKPLSASAKRSGWQGFMYNISKIKNHFVRLK